MASLTLEDFSDILNDSKWNKTFRWLESEFAPLVFLSRKPSMQAPLGTAQRQFVQTLKATSNLLSQLEEIDANRQILPNQQYDRMQMLILCMPILLLWISSATQKSNFTNTVNHRCQ